MSWAALPSVWRFEKVVAGQSDESGGKVLSRRLPCSRGEQPYGIEELIVMNADGRLGRRVNFVVGGLVLTALWIATVLGVKYLLM